MKRQTARGFAAPSAAIAAVIMVCSGLSACGGGGGGGNYLPIPAEAAEAAEAAPPQAQPIAPPIASPSPAPAPSPAEDPRAPVDGSEPEPSLSMPQPGSTAAVGSTGEGVYHDLFGYTFVSADGDIARKTIVGTLWGSLSVTGLNWVFNPGSEYYFVNASPVTGSGTFSPRLSMDGTYAAGGQSAQAFGPLSYSTANALAVDQASVQGKWANTGASGGIDVSLDVDAVGAMTGSTSGSRIGTCGLTGQVVLEQPGTAKNLYSVTLQATNSANAGQPPCALQTGSRYMGPAAIVFVPAGQYASNGYFRALSLLIKHPATKATLSVGLRKQ